MTTTDTPPSLINVKIGGRTYPLVSRPNCRVCQHPDRAEIEHRLLSGGSYRFIATWAADQEPSHLGTPGTNAIRTHAHKHMGMAGSIRRSIVDRRVEEITADPEADTSGADYIALARTIVNIGLEGLADGTLQPELSDVMTAAKFLATYDTQDSGIDADAWRQVLMAQMETARQFIPATAWPAYVNALRTHPSMRPATPAIAPVVTITPERTADE